jgi:isoamylase
MQADERITGHVDIGHSAAVTSVQTSTCPLQSVENLNEPFAAPATKGAAEGSEWAAGRSQRRLRGYRPAIISPHLDITRGHPLPLGASVKRRGTNFAVFSRHTSSVSLIIFVPGEDEPIAEFPLDPRYNRTGDIWHAFIRGLGPGIEYGYRVDRRPNPEGHVHRFDSSKVLIDPYARALSDGADWGRSLHLHAIHPASKRWQPRHSLVVDDAFDWGHDQPLNIHLADSLIYELHVRGFTQHASSGVAHPGTFMGIVEKIPYLKDLGVTAVELMPVTEFEALDNSNINPRTREPLKNFWGYHPISFFAPKASYASNGKHGKAIREFKAMVKALHEAGIEVILDMVFTHTGEGDDQGPTFCFRGLDNATYYLIDPHTGTYQNYSGCGNTLNCNHPVVRDMILDCLRYWVTQMHVDGFRFDLASILGRGRDGSVLPNPPLLERIAADPILANSKLIAEAWDAAGLYQVGTFPNWGRWAEWNGKFRDDIRRFVKSDPGMVPALALRFVGSPDLYFGNGRSPYHSINFITCHDGFSLADMVSYTTKHNEVNGEGGADGTDENYSWNCGEEGPSSSPEVNALRKRQMKNMAAILLLSQGVPMMLAGDEMGRTQQGNNNAYSQDNEISWLNWELLDRNGDMFRFFRRLIRLRNQCPTMRPRTFAEHGTGPWPTIVWHGVTRGQPDWSWDSRSLAMHWIGGLRGNDLFLIANAYWERLRFELPVASCGRTWFRLADTMLESPLDILDEGMEQRLSDQHAYHVGPRSVVVLLGR